MEEDLLNLVVDIFSQQHETDHLERRELLEVFPFDVDVEQVCSLLFFFCISADLFDRSVDQVLGVAVDRAVLMGLRPLHLADLACGRPFPPHEPP